MAHGEYNHESKDDSEADTTRPISDFGIDDIRQIIQDQKLIDPEVKKNILDRKPINKDAEQVVTERGLQLYSFWEEYSRLLAEQLKADKIAENVITQIDANTGNNIGYIFLKEFLKSVDTLADLDERYKLIGNDLFAYGGFGVAGTATAIELGLDGKKITRISMTYLDKDNTETHCPAMHNRLATAIYTESLKVRNSAIEKEYILPDFEFNPFFKPSGERSNQRVMKELFIKHFEIEG